MPYDFGRKNDSHSTYFDVQLCLWAQLPTSHKRQWNSKREVNPAHVCTDPKLDTSLRLTKEAESPAHQWVEVTAVPGGHCLLWPVKLFGRVLDQKQHGLRYCNLLGITARDTQRGKEYSDELRDSLFSRSHRLSNTAPSFCHWFLSGLHLYRHRCGKYRNIRKRAHCAEREGEVILCLFMCTGWHIIDGEKEMLLTSMQPWFTEAGIHFASSCTTETDTKMWETLVLNDLCYRSSCSYYDQLSHFVCFYYFEQHKLHRWFALILNTLCYVWRLLDVLFTKIWTTFRH